MVTAEKGYGTIKLVFDKKEMPTISSGEKGLDPYYYQSVEEVLVCDLLATSTSNPITTKKVVVD